MQEKKNLFLELTLQKKKNKIVQCLKYANFKRVIIGNIKFTMMKKHYKKSDDLQNVYSLFLNNDKSILCTIFRPLLNIF